MGTMSTIIEYIEPIRTMHETLEGLERKAVDELKKYHVKHKDKIIQSFTVKTILEHIKHVTEQLLMLYEDFVLHKLRKDIPTDLDYTVNEKYEFFYKHLNAKENFK